MPSHVGRIKHQNNAKLKTNSFCRHRSESLNLIYMDSMTFKRNAERHFPRMLNVECEYELAQHLFDNKCRPIAESQWCLKGNVLLLRRLIVIRQSVDTRCQTDVAQNTHTDSKLNILAKCRTAFLLKIMESMYIKFNDPDLCQQKEIVYNLALF